jgi:hypothetical protein
LGAQSPPKGPISKSHHIGNYVYHIIFLGGEHKYLVIVPCTCLPGIGELGDSQTLVWEGHHPWECQLPALFAASSVNGCISLLQLRRQNTIDRAAHTTEIYFCTVLELEVQGQDASTMGSGKGLSSWLVDGCFLAVTLLRGETERERVLRCLTLG